MSFLELAKKRQSTRSYDGEKAVENEKIEKLLEAARLAPSACNAQPYHLTVCTGKRAMQLADAVSGIGINRFAPDVPLFIVIAEDAYNATAKIGAKVKHNDYRSIDIGIAAAYITAEAEALGLGSCILGWFDNEKVCLATGRRETVRLVIAVGYPKNSPLRDKKRKSIPELVTRLDKDGD